MGRKITMDVKVRLTMFVNEGVSMDELIAGIDLEGIDVWDEIASIDNIEFEDYEVIDSK